MFIGNGCIDALSSCSGGLVSIAGLELSAFFKKQADPEGQDHRQREPASHPCTPVERMSDFTLERGDGNDEPVAGVGERLAARASLSRSPVAQPWACAFPGVGGVEGAVALARATRLVFMADWELSMRCEPCGRSGTRSKTVPAPTMWASPMTTNG